MDFFKKIFLILKLHKLAGLIALILLFPLYFGAQNNYLFFHSTIEGCSIIIAVITYVLATQTFKYSEDKYLLIVGSAYLFVALFDFLHLMTYKGMQIFPNVSIDIPTQLWIAGRYIAVTSLAIAPLWAKKKHSSSSLFWLYGIISCLILLSILRGLFPTCYIEGHGLSTFKIVSEYVFVLILIWGIYQTYRHRLKLSKTLTQIMITSSMITILSELSFTLYNDVYGLMNFIGHILKIFSYLLIFHGIIIKGFKMPYQTIFRELKKSVITDYLTGLYNRQGFMEYAQKTFTFENSTEAVGLIAMDLDNFKAINDQYGHLTGDSALIQFSKLLKSCIRESDVICRLGGDEFAVIMHGGTKELEIVRQRVKQALTEWQVKDDTVSQLGVSIGIALWDVNTHRNIDDLLRMADIDMYQEKNKSKEQQARGKNHSKNGLTVV